MSATDLPYYMFSQPALTGYVEPALGRGSLTYFVDVSDPIGQGSVNFSFRATTATVVPRSNPNDPLIILPYRPWHDTGWQPFAWDLLPPIAERNYPVIRLVLARDVEFTMRVLQGVSRDAPRNLGFVLGPRSPLVSVFRPQDDSVIPQPGERLEQSRFLRPPTVIGPGADPIEAKRGLNVAATVNVAPRPLGVDITNIGGVYQVTFGIDAKKSHLPAKYAYEVIVPEKPEDVLGVKLRIVHTPNVYIEATAQEGWERNIMVESALVRHISEDVPPQGSSLDGYVFKPVEIDVRRSPKQSVEIFLFELLIGFIPYVGPLYFIAQFSYALATGKDFWGGKVSGGDFLVLGVAALLPLGLRSAREVNTLRAEMKTSPLARVLDEGVTIEVRRVAEKELIEAVGQMDVESATSLARQLTLYASGKATAAQVLKKFNDIVGKAYISALDRRSIEALMTANFQTFKNADLAAGFNLFKSKSTLKGTGRVADPIDWAIRQTSRSRFARALESELGAGWRETLKRSRNDVRLKPMSSTELAHYDKLAGRVEDYKSLAKLNKGHGELFEVDHILEQRFWRNDPRASSAFDEKGEGMAMLVPQNPAVAAKMPGKPIAYVHSTKTRMLTDLIPNRREAEFSVQQIWDAHVFVLESLGVHTSVTFGERVVSNFRMLARARGETLIIRRPTHEFFSPLKKWPVLVGSSS